MRSSTKVRQALECRRRAAIPPRKRRTASGQLFEQRLGVPQERHVEAFGKPAIPRREEVASFRALALVAPQAGEAGRSAKPKRLRALALRHSERSMIILLCSRLVASRIHHIASKSMQLDLTGPLVGRLDELRSLDEAVLLLLQMPDLGVSLGETTERVGRVNDGSGSTKHREPPREHREAVLRLSKCRQRPTMLKESKAQPERKTVLVRESHQLLRVPLCVMQKSGGRLHRRGLAQHKGHRERMVEPAGFRQRLVDARASLIDVAQKRQRRRQVTLARRVRIGHRDRGGNRASGWIFQAITQLEKGARCHKLPAKVA